VEEKVMPKMLYGTGWKEEDTVNLVVDAVTSGFKGIDCASEPTPEHYHEKLVGNALKYLKEKGVDTEKLFL
jgi:diketogulonate reductase-like aldo/keto reductase